MQFFTYKPNGMIVSIGHCPDDSLNAQSVGDVTAVAGVASLGQYYKHKQLNTIPAQPSTYCVFNYNTEVWEDPRSLQELKDAKWMEVKQARNAAEFAEFTYNGMMFDGDLDAQRRLAGYISLSKSFLATGQTFEAEFTLADNSTVVLTATDFVAIEVAKVQQVAAAFAQASALRTQIEGTTSIDQLNLIQWTS